MPRCTFCRPLTVESFRALLPFHDNLASLKKSAEGGCDFCLLCWTGFEKRWKPSDIDSVLRIGSPEGAQDFDPSIWIYGHFQDISPTVSQPQLMVSCGRVAVANGEPENRNSMPPVDLELFARSGTPGALRIPGRLYAKSHEPDLYPSMIRRWLRMCENCHKCGPEGNFTMPTRLIDVGDPREGMPPRLHIVNPSTSEKYLALSYCWGPATDTFTLNSTTMEKLLNGIHEPDLAPAHRDIISLARSLDIRFVWIDALCIIQGDANDWEYESQRMAFVYGNATLTIMAGRSADARNHFLVNNLEQAARPCEFPIDEHEGSEFAFVGLRRSRALGPLETRGWCLQEKRLSRRVVVFGEQQLHFWCLKRSDWEDGLTVHETGSILNTALSPSVQELGIGARRRHLLRVWDTLVVDFSSRHLSNPHDVFAAIASVAGQLEQVMESRYLAGLWECDLVRGLLWKPGYQISAYFKLATRPQPTRFAPGPVIRAPSWSWAAIQGHVHNVTYDNYQRRVTRNQASGYVKVKPGLRDPDRWTSDPSCGASKLHMPSCELQLVGRLTQAVVLTTPASEYFKQGMTYAVAWRNHGYPLGRKRKGQDSYDPNDPMVALGVFDFESEREDEVWCLQLTMDEGLILHRREDGKFYRLGWLYFPNEHWSDGFEEEQLILV